MSDFTKTTQYSRLTNLQPHYPYVPRKSEVERKTKGKIREEEIREKISPPLDPPVVSELVVRVLWWWACTTRGWPPLFLYPLGTCLIASQKFLEMSQWAWGVCGGSWWSQASASPRRQVLNFLGYVT